MKKIILFTITLFGLGILTGAVISSSFGWNLDLAGAETQSEEDNDWMVTLEMPNGTMLYQGDETSYDLPIIELPVSITVPFNQPIIELPERPIIGLPPIVPVNAEYNKVMDALIIPDINNSLNYMDSQGNIWIPVHPGIISGTGEVQYIDLEDGFYGIITDDGECYDPINLPSEFKEDSLQINFKAKILGDYVNYHMWGTIIEILEIEILN